MAVDFQPGGRLSAHNVPLKVLIQLAYHVRPETVTGGPGWLESDRFDVVAKAPPTTPPDDIRGMLRSLLADRCKLAVHTDQKIMPAYALVLAKDGPRLRPSEAALLTDQRCGPGEGPAGQKHVACRHMGMALLANTLQEIAPRDIDRPVVDQTGLAGVCNFKLDLTLAARAGAGEPTDAPAGTSLSDALESQLGLRLESKKLPLPVIVIDRVDRVPVAN